jgi:hypoxanthine phosphoribosyltransferase
MNAARKKDRDLFLSMVFPPSVSFFLDWQRSVEYKNTMPHEELKPLHGPRAIRKAVHRLAAAIDDDSDGEPLTVIGVLKGSFVFLADLVRALNTQSTVDFVTVSSYGAGLCPGALRLVKDCELPLWKRNVLLVDDIVDTGLTTGFLLHHIRRRRPRSCRLCALLDKPFRRRVRIAVDYRGFVAPDRFIVGYGLDMNERYRQLPGLYTVETEGPHENERKKR